jgi:hypothetical protein
MTECALCLLSAVAHRCEADAAEFSDGAKHVEHDAGLTCLVEMETMADCDVEEVVDREAAQQVRLEVVARDEVLLADARSQTTKKGRESDAASTGVVTFVKRPYARNPSCANPMPLAPGFERRYPARPCRG